MTDLEDFLPLIIPQAPGCPAPTAFKGIIKAAQELCERTRLWRERDTFNVTPSSCNVICAPDGADLFEIEAASLDGMALEPISITELDYRRPGWRTDEPGAGQYITQVTPGSLLVVPGTTGKLALATILRPSNDATQLPDFIGAQYQREIVDGALAEILMTPGQNFTDPSRAQFYASRFELKLSQITSRTVQGQQRAKMRTRPSFF